MANTIETIMESKGTPTLKAIAGVFGLQAVRLYSVAKQPKAGVIYDAKVFNWDAIERFISRRLDADKGLATIEDVISKALELDEQYKSEDGRKVSRTGAKKEMLTVDGKQIPARKFPNFEMAANLPIVLKKDTNVYKIVYQTVSHTVLVPVNEDGTSASNDVKVISNFMLNFKGFAAAALSDEVAKRFSGEKVADSTATAE